MKMTMKVIQLISLVVLYSCASGQVTTPTTPTPDLSGLEVQVEQPSKPVATIESVKVFSFRSSLNLIKNVNECANKVVNDKEFQEELKSVERFDFSNASGETVLNKLLNHKCVIQSYKTKNPFSKVLATTYINNKTDVYLNMRKYQTIEAWSGTSIHECSHNFGFSHGNNSSAGKQNSVPYFIGFLGQRHAERICNFKK